MGRSQNWEMAMKYQRKNGSLFNSPATTASAFTHLCNADCLRYPNSLLDKLGNAVPTVYPLDVYARLCMVDSLERLGIHRHFEDEITSVLNETYRLWEQKEEDILLEPATCALAFRLLRQHGYDVSSEALSQYSEDKFLNSLQGYLKDVGAIVELYRASQIVIHLDESVLEELNSWTRHLLKNEYLSSSKEHPDKYINNVGLEVYAALQFPHHSYLDRLLTRRSIEIYDVDHKKMLKTANSCWNIGNEEFLKLAMEDFNICQSLYRQEFDQYKRWFVESGLDKLEFPRPKMVYSYVTAAATLVSPELSDARLSWAKNGLLVSITDDFHDVWGTEEEQRNLIELIHKYLRWNNVDVTKECYSEKVEILFSALQGTICEVADNALKFQGRCVTNHLIELWLDVLKSFYKEAEWMRSKYVPSIEEYMKNALTSFALGPIVLPALYLVGPKLPIQTIYSSEYKCLFEAVSVYGRLFNDINGFKRELRQGKLNAVALHAIHGCGAVTEEEIIKKFKGIINEKTRELLRLVLQEKGSSIPRACKDVFWQMAKSLHLVYNKEDVLHSIEMPAELLNFVDAVLKEPITLK